jgi:hypothetical protein
VASNGKREGGSDLERASAEIVRTRDGLVLAIGALEQEINRTLDWREWVRRWPGRMLALAFGVGLLLGRRRSNLGERW